MQEWLNQPIGKYFLKLETEQANSILPKLFGYHFVLLGEYSFISTIQTSPILSKIIINPNHNSNFNSNFSRANISTLCAEYSKLPVANESVDVIYLAHCLEFIDNPHEILREAYRILRPQGYIIIAAFNPLSLWGARCILNIFNKTAPWNGHFLSSTKLKDWLALLGFDIISLHCFGCLWPLYFNSFLEKQFKKMPWLADFEQRYRFPFGVTNLLLGCKMVNTLTPIKPHWQKKSLLDSNLVEPSSRVRG